MWQNRAVGALLLAAVAGCGEGAKAPPPEPGPAASRAEKAPDGEVLEVKRGKARRETPCVGVLKAKRTTRLGPQVSGRIAAVLVKEGDTVIAGQEVAKLETLTFDIEVAQREADLKVEKVALVAAERQYKRILEMFDKKGEEPTVSRKAFDEAQLQFETAGARVNQADVALRKANNSLAETTLKAPYAGVVTKRFVDPGQPVTSTPVTEVVEIQQEDELDLDFLLPQPILARFHAGSDIQWSVDGVPGDDRDAKIASILPDVDEATRSFRCRATVPNADRRLKPGMLARVRVIDESTRESIFVPGGAVEALQAGSQVHVVQDGKPFPRAVKTGETFGETIEIVEGLKDGESILVPRPAR